MSTPNAGTQLIKHRQHIRSDIARKTREQRAYYQQQQLPLEEQHRALRAYLTYRKPPEKPTPTRLRRELEETLLLLQETPAEPLDWMDSREDLKQHAHTLKQALTQLTP
ncbi:MAG TPA: hypothetical protein VK054_09315 [Beutenbergiaceae bacterium]|nr:hypothetical protein [Beutenbergiaceae bacterium]